MPHELNNQTGVPRKSGAKAVCTQGVKAAKDNRSLS